MRSHADVMSSFEVTTFEALGARKTVYRAGQGPGIVVMTEVPGITPEVAAFAERLVGAGYEVAMPDLFGTAGKPLGRRYGLRTIAGACVSREFALLAAKQASPVTDWLRALARDLAERTSGPVGAIGMCLTGNFALALALDETLVAPVLSQPSLPVGPTKCQKAGVHLSDAGLAILKRRVEDEGLRVLGMRFSHDMLSPVERFDSLREALGEGFEAIEIDSGPGNAHGIPRIAHSVVTNDLVDRPGHPTRDALDRLLAYFDERLHPARA